VGEEVVSHDAQEMNKNPLQGDFSLPRTQNAPSVNSEMNGFKREANCPNARGGRSWVQGLLFLGLIVCFS